jgi:hypothetical protein
MKILSTVEEEAFEPPPVSNGAERKQFFSLLVMLKDAMEDLCAPTNGVCVLVTADYFKAQILCTAISAGGNGVHCAPDWRQSNWSPDSAL